MADTPPPSAGGAKDAKTDASPKSPASTVMSVQVSLYDVFGIVFPATVLTAFFLIYYREPLLSYFFSASPDPQLPNNNPKIFELINQVQFGGAAFAVVLIYSLGQLIDSCGRFLSNLGFFKLKLLQLVTLRHLKKDSASKPNRRIKLNPGTSNEISLDANIADAVLRGINSLYDFKEPVTAEDYIANLVLAPVQDKIQKRDIFKSISVFHRNMCVVFIFALIFLLCASPSFHHWKPVLFAIAFILLFHYGTGYYAKCAEVIPYNQFLFNYCKKERN